ncbi:aryl-alcohol dehydrogenase [Xylaria sp. FL1042]|nr:aryl-alcohol dehydrogenase [Xylaria sp. FL1042]
MEHYTYDFVIVGGGTAGLVLASRLSEDATQRILVLEAGKDHTDDLRIKIPAMYASMLKSDVDWDFESVNQSGLNGRKVPLNQGRVLGGSSATNAQVFAPPGHDIINAWETLGNTGWNWNTLKGYYTKTFTPPFSDPISGEALEIEDQFSSGDSVTDASPQGPVQLSFPGNLNHPIREAWKSAFKSRGYGSTGPWTSESTQSFNYLASIDPITKERSYSASAYYSPIKSRNNTRVITEATVERVLLGKGADSTKAVGVQYKYNGAIETVTAAKEVIVAAGALQSPKVLELSGVGNAALLSEHGIPVIEDLPGVGENLQDHIVCDISYQAVDDLETLDSLVRQEPEAIGAAMQDYAINKSGILTSVGIMTYAYMPVVDILSEEDQSTMKAMLEQNKPLLKETRGWDKTLTQESYEVIENAVLEPHRPSGVLLTITGQNPVSPPPISATIPSSADGGVAIFPGKWISLAAMLSLPFSRGSAHIISNDPSQAPAIDPNYFSNPIDIQVMAHHLRYLETIASSPSFGKVVKQPLQHQDAAAQFANIESAKDYLRSRAVSMWHLAGSCSMLPRDKGGVVDTKLKVYGVNNLRIVDSSIMPLITTGNLQPTVYAVAEKAADMIKEEYGLM